MRHPPIVRRIAQIAGSAILVLLAAFAAVMWLAAGVVGGGG